MSIELDSVGSGYNLSSINTNFDLIQDFLNDVAVKREVGVGEANEMRTHLDMNHNAIVNIATDPEDPNSMITVAGGDARYVNVDGDEMTGILSLGGNKVVDLGNGEDVRDAVNVSQLNLSNAGGELVDLVAVARSLNVNNFDVIEESNTTDLIPGFLYSATQQKTYIVPVNAQGDTIVSVVADQLETNVATYTMVASLSDTGVTNTEMTTFGKAKATIFDSDGPYTAWPYGALFLDGAGDAERVIQVYTTGSGHVAGDKEVRMRKRSWNSNVWGDFVNVSSGASTRTCHAAGRMPNGDYIAIIRAGEAPTHNTHLYRSTDQGVSWAFSSDITPTANPVEAGSIFVTSQGTILTFGRDSGLDTYVLRSTDNGNTWTKHDVPNNTIGHLVLEGAFAETADNTLVVYCRSADSVGEPFPIPVASQFSTCTDDGETWEELADSPSIVDMTGNPASIIKHPVTGHFEIFYGSRHAPDGKASIYHAYSTDEDIKLGIWHYTNRLAAGENKIDFGYPAAVASSQAGKVMLNWYAGGNGKLTRIVTAIGTLAGFGSAGSSVSEQTSLIHPTTGREMVYAPNFGVNDNAKEQIGILGVVGLIHPDFDGAIAPTRFMLEYLFTQAKWTSLISGTLPSTAQVIDAKAILTAAGVWNSDIAGLVVEVILESSTTNDVWLSMGRTDAGKETSKRIFYKHDTSNPVKQLENITIPINADGTVRVDASSATDITAALIRVKGYVSQNVV